MRFIWLLLFWCSLASAGVTTSRQIDTITNSTGGSGLSVPSTGTTLATDTNTLTFSGKTISGASNTLSNLPVATQFVQDIFTGNGSTTAFTLSFTQVAAAGLVVHLDGVALIQGASNDYTVSGTTLTMNTAPATGQRILAVYSQK